MILGRAAAPYRSPRYREIRGAVTGTNGPFHISGFLVSIIMAVKVGRGHDRIYPAYPAISALAVSGTQTTALTRLGVLSGPTSMLISDNAVSWLTNSGRNRLLARIPWSLC
jgi:hypothetical protein